MIDISEFINKLEVLKLWIFDNIDRNIHRINFEIDASPQSIAWEEMMNIWNQTGWLMYSSEKVADLPSIESLIKINHLKTTTKTFILRLSCKT